MGLLQDYKRIIFDILKLSLPILGGNISQILIGLSDTIVAGRYSTVALGAVSVASAIIMTATIAAIGLILSISPVISNLRGANVPSKKYFKLTVLFSILVSLPFYLFVEILIHKLDFLGLSPDLVEPVRIYLQIVAISIIPGGIFVALKEFLQAYEKVLYPNLLMLFMVVLNLILNLVLAFGWDFGFIVIPALGVKGLALATTLSRLISTLMMVIYCIPMFYDKFSYSASFLKDLFKTGYPISIAMFLEFLGFNLTAVLIGKFSAVYAAVHNVVLSIANVTFMVALSVSNATSIKVGYYNGKEDKTSIIRYSISAILIIMLICLVAFIVLGFFQDEIIMLFSKDKEVLRLSKEILFFAMCFLFFDGIQCACVGILKGLKDTKIIMIAMCSGYLLVAIPLGCYLAFVKNHVLDGFWLGLALALFTVAVITATRLVWDVRKIDFSSKKLD